MSKTSLPYAASLAILKKLAAAHKNRKQLNNAVKRAFGNKLGEGAFRVVFGHAGYVFKLRRCEVDVERDDNFSVEEVASSNSAETKVYRHLKKNFPACAQFALSPRRHLLPNGHDVVVMKQVKTFDENFNIYDHRGEDACEPWHPLVQEQSRVISRIFLDSHDANLGYTGDLYSASGRIYMIDLNWEGEKECLDDVESQAKALLRKMKVA